MKGNFSKISSLFLLIMLPFWDVIVPQFTKISSGFFYVIGPIRYEIMIAIVFIGFIVIFKKGKFIKSLNILLLFFYFLSMIISLIITNHHILLSIEGIKLQLLMIVFMLMIIVLTNGKQKKLPSITLITKIFYLQLIFVLFIALIELYNQNILVFLYGKSLEELPHISFFSFQRLISLIGNPINLGAFILVCLAFINSKFIQKESSKILYLFILFLSGVIILLTLSRLALLVYMIFILLISINKGKKAVLYLIITIFIGVIISFNFIDLDLGKMGDRIFNIFNSDTISGNSRLDNWSYAFSQINNINFIFGFGLGQSNPSSELVSSHNAFMIENTFVSVFIDLGLVGFIIYFVIFIRFIYLAISYYIFTLNPAFIYFILIFALFSLANDFHRNMPFSFYFWFFLIWLEVTVNNLRRNTICKIN